MIEAVLQLAAQVQGGGSPDFTSLALQYGGASLIAIVAWFTQQKRVGDRDRMMAATKTDLANTLAAKDKDMAIKDARIAALEAQLAKAQDDRVRSSDDWAQQNRELALRMVPTLEKAGAAMAAMVAPSAPQGNQ